MKRSLAIMILSALFIFPRTQVNVSLKGKVYDENRNPVKNLSLRFTTVGTAVTTNSGEFIIEVPDEMKSVELDLPDRTWSVLYPVDQRIAVPSDRNHVVKIVVEKSSSSSDARDIAKKYINLESLLKELGLAQNELRTLLEDFIKRESDEKNLEEENLKSLIYKEKRNERFAIISSALLKYQLKAENVKNAFRIVTDFAFENKSALNELVGIVLDYNLILNEINNNKFAFRSDVSLFWQDKALANELYDTFNYALDEVHRPYILNLNDEITEMNKILAAHYRDRDEREDVKKRISQNLYDSIRELEIKLPVLERRINEVLVKLQNEI